MFSEKMERNMRVYKFELDAAIEKMILQLQ